MQINSNRRQLCESLDNYQLNARLGRRQPDATIIRKLAENLLGGWTVITLALGLAAAAAMRELGWWLPMLKLIGVFLVLAGLSLILKRLQKPARFARGSDVRPVGRTRSHTTGGQDATLTASGVKTSTGRFFSWDDFAEWRLHKLEDDVILLELRLRRVENQLISRIWWISGSLSVFASAAIIYTEFHHLSGVGRVILSSLGVLGSLMVGLIGYYAFCARYLPFGITLLGPPPFGDTWHEFLYRTMGVQSRDFEK